MKHIFTTITLLAMVLSLASCEREIIVNCNCQCNHSNGSDQNTGRPNNGGNNGGNSSDNNDNTGDNGNNGDNTGNTTNRDEYETYNNTLTQGKAGYYGVYYDGQPSNTSNWYLELADNNYDLEKFEGDGYNICIEFFTNSSSSTSIPAGEYTIEAFEKNEFSAGSVLNGYIAEDETYGEYPAGTWLYAGNEGIAAATAGYMNITISGGQYNINYTFYDDEYQIAFCGSYIGNLTIYDGTVEHTESSQTTKSPRSGNKHYRVRL